MRNYWQNNRIHYIETLKLGLPVIVSQLGQITVGLADNIMIGQLGTSSLAAASFANTLLSLPLIFGMGFAMSLTPLAGRAFADKNLKEVKTLWQNGLVTNISMSILLLVAASLLYWAMPLMNQPAHLIPVARGYYVYVALSLLPMMLFMTGKQLFEGMANTKTAMMITLGGNVVNIAGNYIFMYGKLGMPEMGLNGAGFSTLIARCLMASVMIFIVLRNRVIARKYHQGVGIVIRQIRRLYRLGLPMGLHIFSESSAFIVAGIMMGWIGENGLAAHQIVISLSTLGFMVYQGIGVSTTIRISQLSSRGNAVLLKHASKASVHIVMVLVGIISTMFLALSTKLPYLFTQSTEVASTATGLIMILVIFQIFDAMQIVFSGVLRGMADARVPGILTMVSYFGVAIPVSYLAAFHAGLGPIGIWLGFPIGLAVCATLFFFRIRKMLSINIYSK
jgi:MATE family multidrug resistance protein